jgi:hypothetical protein
MRRISIRMSTSVMAGVSAASASMSPQAPPAWRPRSRSTACISTIPELWIRVEGIPKRSRI